LRDKFPPETTHEREVWLLLAMLSTVAAARSSVYVSTPITSGRRLADWFENRDPQPDISHPEYQEFQRKVAKLNSEHARTVIQQLRNIFAKTLIDPTALKDIEGWIQNDYRYFWAKVIEQYADTVVFLDGWQFSNGCAYEFLIANRTRPAPAIINEDLKPLTLEDGVRLVEAAVQELRRSKLQPDFLSLVLRELMNLSSRQEALVDA